MAAVKRHVLYCMTIDNACMGWWFVLELKTAPYTVVSSSLVILYRRIRDQEIIFVHLLYCIACNRLCFLKSQKSFQTMPKNRKIFFC